MLIRISIQHKLTGPGYHQVLKALWELYEFTSINFKKCCENFPSKKKKPHLINKLPTKKIDTLMKIKFLKADTKWREVKL